MIPYKVGKVTNYFHFWVDYMIPLMIYIKRYPEEVIVLNNEKEGFLKKFNYLLPNNILYGKSDKYEIVKGHNPMFVKWEKEQIKVIEKIKSEINPKNTEKKYIFIVRNEKNRFIKNKEETFLMLKEIIPKIEKVELENKTFEEQVEMFHNAKVVIGQHGAGLVNIIWTKEECVVIEIDKNHGRKHFENLCKSLKKEYYKYDAVKKELPLLKDKKKAEKININLEEFAKFIADTNLKMKL